MRFLQAADGAKGTADDAAELISDSFILLLRVASIDYHVLFPVYTNPDMLFIQIAQPVVAPNRFASLDFASADAYLAAA